MAQENYLAEGAQTDADEAAADFIRAGVRVVHFPPLCNSLMNHLRLRSRIKNPPSPEERLAICCEALLGGDET